MAPSSDDRDRNFEKALARHARATSQAETSSASPSCADLEALAAYHEGALSPEQRNLWKAHIQTCPRCQEILAQLQATDAIPLDLPDHSEKQESVRVPVLKPRDYVERDGPTMFARIGVMSALHRNVERVFNPDRKDTHWGRRKLARDR